MVYRAFVARRLTRAFCIPFSEVSEVGRARHADEIAESGSLQDTMVLHGKPVHLIDPAQVLGEHDGTRSPLSMFISLSRSENVCIGADEILGIEELDAPDDASPDDSGMLPLSVLNGHTVTLIDANAIDRLIHAAH